MRSKRHPTLPQNPFAGLAARDGLAFLRHLGGCCGAEVQRASSDFEGATRGRGTVFEGATRGRGRGAARWGNGKEKGCGLDLLFCVEQL